MKDERIWILMSRKMAGEATEDELKELEALLGIDPGLHYSFIVANELKALRVQNSPSEAEEEALLQRGLAKIDVLLNPAGKEIPVIRAHNNKRHSLKRLMAFAAVLLLLIAGIYSIVRYSQDENFGDEIATKTGSKTTIVLPDGTKVWLNACSKLQYTAASFIKGDRQVFLQGEGFFEVKNDAYHPFIIHAGKILIRDLGTSFNVKAYPEDNFITTTLICGKIEIDFKDASGQKLVLKPNQKLTILKTGEIKENGRDYPLKVSGKDNAAMDFSVISIKKKDSTITSAPETAWIDNRLEFDGETFAQLSHDLERWYNVKIHFENNRYKNEVFTGAFKNQPIEEVFQALQLTSSFHYSIDGDNNVKIW